MRKTSKIYVAGHRGLVGSAISRELRERGYENIITRTHKEMDLTNQNAVSDFFENEQPEYVILAAAKVGGIVANNIYRADFIYENLMIQSNVIHESYKHGVKKLLFLGSTCIYPKECPQPIKEEYLLTGPLEYTNEPYAIAKISGIKMCESYNVQHGTNFISVMPTNLYGPNDNFDLEKSHVLPALIRKIHLGKQLHQENWEGIKTDLSRLPVDGVNGSSQKEEILRKLNKHGIVRNENSVSVEVWGSGKPRREFLWSEDMAAACLFILENRNFHDCITDNNEVRNTHINIGTGKDVSIKQLVFSIKKIIGFEGEIVFNPQKPDGTMKKLTDTSKLNNLGWKHSVELEEGIKRLYNWYISQ